jgi:hypothetical protein
MPLHPCLELHAHLYTCRPPDRLPTETPAKGLMTGRKSHP